jgi:hypothetical protein
VKQAKLRVLVTADAVGGVWQYSIDLARSLSALQIETVLVVLGPSPSPAQLKMADAIKGLILVDTGLPLDWLAETRESVRTAAEAVAALAETYSADIVQLNGAALAAEVKFPVPVVAIAHSCIATWWKATKGTEPDDSYKWRADLTGKGLKAADHVVAPSAAFAVATQLAYALETKRRRSTMGALPWALPRVAPHDFAFTAGRLWTRARMSKPSTLLPRGWRCRFMPPGRIAAPMGWIDLHHARGLGNLGEKELARWIAPRPVFVSAAVYEPFGLAVLEAAAAGCPLVLSDIPTFRELWEGAAIFVDPMDSEGFARAVTSLVGDELMRDRMGAAARERAKRFTPEWMAAQMAEIYRRLTGRREASQAMVAA